MQAVPVDFILSKKELCRFLPGRKVPCPKAAQAFVHDIELFAV